MAIDPRRRFPFGQMAPMMYGAGTLNNAAPMFQGPAYYNQMFNRPIQDWYQFMPTNSPLAGGGGALYQNPWGYGTGGGSGWGGAFGGGGGMMGGGLMGGGLMGGGYPGGYGGGYPGGYGYPGGGYPGGGGTSSGFYPPWAIPTDPSLAPPTTGAGRGETEGPTFSGNYDAFGAPLDQWGNPIDLGVPWQNTFLAPLGNRMGVNWAGYEPGQGQDMGSRTWAGGVTDDDIDAMMMADADMGGVRPTTPGTDFFGGDVRAPVASGAYGGFLGDRMGAPPATNPITGLLRDYGTMATEEFDSPTAGTNFMGPLTDPSYGDVTSQIDTFRGVPMSQPGTDFFGGDVTAPATPAPVTPAWSPPSMTPTAPATPAVDNFAQVQAQAQAAAASQAQAAQAQARARAVIAESQSRDRGGPSSAELQAAREVLSGVDTFSGGGLGFLGRDERNGGYSESGMGQQGGRGHPGMR